MNPIWAHHALLAALPGTTGPCSENGTYHGWFMAPVQKTELTWDIPTTAGASQELHDPSPGSATSRTKVQGCILGKDPFSAGGPQNCNTLAFTKLNQCFYKWDWKRGLDLLTVKLLSWWKGAESLCADWAHTSSLRITRWGQLNKSWYSSSCVWKCLIDLEAQNFNAVLFCIDRGLWSHLNALLSIHKRI